MIYHEIYPKNEPAFTILTTTYVHLKDCLLMLTSVELPERKVKNRNFTLQLCPRWDAF